MIRRNFSYQLIENSPWVIYSTMSIMSIMIGNIMYINRYNYGGTILIISLLALFINLDYWNSEILEESTIRGEHTERVQEGLKKGFILFVISEICIFLTLFYSFFYSSIIPDISLGSIWPPIGITTIDFKSIPLLNTALLFFSGITITVAQYRIKEGNEKESILYMQYTILLGIIFVFLQYIEYKYSLYSLTDSIYGNIFFSLTGFHGIHVIMGIIFIYIAYKRLLDISISHHLNFVFSSIYYHFVDIVWLFLYALLYIWGSASL